MKRKLYTLFLLSAPILVSAQKTNPAPYCQSEYNTNYNMLQAISVGAYTHSFGPMGSIGTPNTYLYVDTANLPSISKSSSTSVFLDFYSVADVEPAYFGIWIDYDQSNSFEASELVFHNENTLKKKLPSGSSSGISLPLSLKAAALAKNGKTRMRIVRSQKQSDGSGPYDAAFRLDPCNIKSSAGGIFGCTYDFDIEIVGTSSIDEQLLRSQLTLTPNPATDKISIQNTSNQKVNNVIVLDLSGKKLFETETALEINISQYATGVYFAKLTMENGAVLPIKFVKN
jgi:hypothetical protein